MSLLNTISLSVFTQNLSDRDLSMSIEIEIYEAEPLLSKITQNYSEKISYVIICSCIRFAVKL